MFYEGDLQSGIALALEESKCVVCFVRDDGEESSKWETDWLAGDERIVEYLGRNAVTLRLQAGSQEAGYLSSFYPVASVPALVMIDQGKVEQTLLSGVEQDAFTPALIGALSRVEHRKRAARSQLAATAATAAAAASPRPATTPSTELQAASPPPAPSPSTEPEATTSNQEAGPSGITPAQRAHVARIQALLAERRQRLEADKKAKDAAEKGKQKERAQAREASSSSPGKRTAEQTYAQQQKQAKLEAAKEKERIRKLVELDKLERKEREEQRRALARAEREAALPQEEAQAAVASGSGGADKADRRGCMVQVRLLDGSTMRASFFPEDKPAQAVRKWVDGNRTDGDYPYTFKQIMTPAPSKIISDADEKTTLRELGMTPSVSLVLVPVKGVVAAYQGGGAVGLLNNFLTFIGAVFMGIFDALFRLMQNIMGVRDSADGQQRPPTDQSAASGNGSSTGAGNGHSEEGGANINIRTLRDRQGREDHQLYNGNSLDFEPRKDDDADSKGEHGSK